MEAAGAGSERRRGRKRGHGEGTIYERKDGRWIAELMVGRRPDGKKDVRTASAPTRGEVQRKLTALRVQAQQGLVGDPAAARDTVGRYLARWLEATRSTLRPSCRPRPRNRRPTDSPRSASARPGDSMSGGVLMARSDRNVPIERTSRSNSGYASPSCGDRARIPFAVSATSVVNVNAEPSGDGAKARTRGATRRRP